MEKEGYNCRSKNRENCPLNGECLTKNVMYEASIISYLANYGDKKYKGVTYNPFKTRLGNQEKKLPKQGVQE